MNANLRSYQVIYGVVLKNYSKKKNRREKEKKQVPNLIIVDHG